MDNEWKDQFDYYYDKVNNANVESAQKQMDFQREMSSSSHVREVKDLIEAGLNPVLSANNGASTPMGAYANVDSSPISAKFASKNLDKELENARKITAMQNDNSYKIAMAQLANQMQLGKYTVDTQTKTQRFDTIVQEYGLLAGLAYGLAEDMYNGDTNLESSVKSILETGGQINSIWDLYNSAKSSADQGVAYADDTLDKSAQALGYKDNADYKFKKSFADHVARIKSNLVRNDKVLNRSDIALSSKVHHKNSFNKYRPKKAYWK